MLSTEEIQRLEEKARTGHAMAEEAEAVLRAYDNSPARLRERLAELEKAGAGNSGAAFTLKMRLSRAVSET